jgi:hypothetical protein
LDWTHLEDKTKKERIARDVGVKATPTAVGLLLMMSELDGQAVQRLFTGAHLWLLKVNGQLCTFDNLARQWDEANGLICIVHHHLLSVRHSADPRCLQICSHCRGSGYCWLTERLHQIGNSLRATIASTTLDSSSDVAAPLVPLACLYVKLVSNAATSVAALQH